MKSGLRNFIRSGVVSAMAALAFVPAAPSTASAAGKTFNFVFASHDMANFRANAEVAARLKPYGRVQVNVSTLPDKSWYTVPEGGSSWHEYAAYNPTFFKFFPHPKVAPFLPADALRSASSWASIAKLSLKTA